MNQNAKNSSELRSVADNIDKSLGSMASQAREDHAEVMQEIRALNETTKELAMRMRKVESEAAVTKEKQCNTEKEVEEVKEKYESLTKRVNGLALGSTALSTLLSMAMVVLESWSKGKTP